MSESINRLIQNLLLLLGYILGKILHTFPSLKTQAEQMSEQIRQGYLMYLQGLQVDKATITEPTTNI